MELFQVGWGIGMWIELLLLGGAAASLWFFRGRAVGERPGSARALTVALAVIGALALIVLAAMVLTHYRMMP